MDDLVVGILLALVASAVIPFLTAQASAWVEARRDRAKRIRELFEIVTASEVTEPQQSHAGWSEQKFRKWEHERNKALVLVRSYFGPLDGSVREVTSEWGMLRPTPEGTRVMQLWATGHRWTARRKARKLLKQGNVTTGSPQAQESQQSGQGQLPEQSGPSQAE